MPRAREVQITKGDLKATVVKESLPVWERNGWTVADDGSSEGSSAPAESEPKSEAPAKKTTTRKKAE